VIERKPRRIKPKFEKVIFPWPFWLVEITAVPSKVVPNSFEYIGVTATPLARKFVMLSAGPEPSLLNASNHISIRPSPFRPELES
jgi:hypothetical protein